MSHPRPTDPHAAHRRPLPPGTPAAVGRYEVLRPLGAGPFGRVFLAHDPHAGRYVALKVPDGDAPRDALERFLSAARAAADVHHPNVCPVYDVGAADPEPYVARRCAGAALDEFLAADPPDPPAAIGLALQIAKGLEAAHARGVVHGALKPANVLYDAPTGQLLLTDFGPAPGPPADPVYAAPEQWDARFGPIGAHTDVYAVGVLLFRLLTGGPPFAGGAADLMRAHCDRPPPRPTELRPGLDPRCDAVCLRALAKDPEKRFGSATECAAALAALLAPPPGAGGATWAAGVPGMWYARAADAPFGARWELSTPTPGPVPGEPGRVYRLEVSPVATDADLARLADLHGFPALHRLDLNGCEQITDAGAARAAGLGTLQSLHLRWCQRLTDAALAALAPLADLRALDLRGCKQITDAGAGHLRAFRRLEALDVTFCNRLSDAALAHLGALPALRTLNLSECYQVSDAGLSALAGLRDLRVLHLNWCLQLTDAGVVALAALPNLAELSVQGCPQLTDAGLAVLAGAPALRWLHAGGCDGITDSGRAALQAAKPHLKIER